LQGGVKQPSFHCSAFVKPAQNIYDCVSFTFNSENYKNARGILACSNSFNYSL